MSALVFGGSEPVNWTSTWAAWPSEEGSGPTGGAASVAPECPRIVATCAAIAAVSAWVSG